MTSFFKDLKNLKFNYKLGKKTWFGSGGNSTFFIEINSVASLQKLLKFVPYFASSRLKTITYRHSLILLLGRCIRFYLNPAMSPGTCCCCY